MHDIELYDLIGSLEKDTGSGHTQRVDVTFEEFARAQWEKSIKMEREYHNFFQSGSFRTMPINVKENYGYRR